MIQREKNRFRDIQTRKNKEKIMQHNRELELERARQGELIRSNAEKQRLERDVANLKGNNEKVSPPQKSKLRLLGEGLAKAFNEHKEKVRTKQTSGGGMSFGFGGSHLQARRPEQPTNTNNNPFSGGSGPNFGTNFSKNAGLSHNLFDMKPAGNIPKQKQIKKVVYYR